jgi:hypothetical protein
LKVIVLDDHAGNVPTFQVNICPFTTGCHTFGFDVDEFATYCNHAGNVSFTSHGQAASPLFQYVIVYVTISPEYTSGLSIVFLAHKSTHCIINAALDGLFNNNESGSFTADIVSLLFTLSFVQTGVSAFIVTLILIVHDAHGAKLAIRQVSTCPFIVG